MKRILSVGTPLLVVGLLLGVFTAGCGPEEVQLTAYVGDGMIDPMLRIQEVYQEQNPHVTIEFSFAGSGTLEETIRTLEFGDLYMPGSKKYIDSLAEDGLVVNSYPVALHVPSMIVRRGDTLVTSWEDLAADGVRVGMPNPELASAGRMADLIISRSPLGKEIRANITVLAADTREVIQLLLDGEVDAALSWGSAVGIAPDQLTVVEIPADINEVQELWFAVIAYSTLQKEAATFAEFVAGPEGQQAFREAGFRVIE